MPADASSNPATPVLMPKLGQAMEEGTVVEWHVADGATVTKGDVILTIETDKSTYDLEATASGPLHIVHQAGEEVPIETVLAWIGEGVPESAPAAGGDARASTPAATAPPARRTRVKASPKARRLAEERGVDLAAVTASADDGVISADDVLRAADAGGTTVDQPFRRERERRRLSGIPRASARRLAQSWAQAPHIVQMVDVDASRLRAAARVGRDDGMGLNELILTATAQTMARHPNLNATLEGEELVLYEGVDVGFAVDTERGLVAPVVRGADALPLPDFAAEVKRLIEAARTGKLAPDEQGDASCTVSNLGMFGIRAGTPVLNLGEPVLVFVGAIEERPVALERTLAVRPTLTLSIAYDHRIADGVAAARFTQDLKEALESVEAPSGAGAAPPPERDAGGRTVTAASEGVSFQVALRAGTHAWAADEPRARGGSDAGPTPVHAFLGSLLSCLIVSLQNVARRRGLTLERVEGRIHSPDERRLESIRVELTVWSDTPRDKLEAMLAPAERGCYVRNALDPAIDYQATLEVRTPGQ